MCIIVIVHTVDICSYFFAHNFMYKKFKSGVTNKLFRALFLFNFFIT